MGFELDGIDIGSGVLCAPICGATKVPYRRLAQRYGAGLTYTEMIKAIALVNGQQKSYELARREADETPIGAQLCGADPGLMARAGAIIEELGFETIDINMGCPVRKVVSEGAGAALMRDTKQVEAVVGALVKAVEIPVTIKIRSGWTRAEGNALEVSRAAEQAGARMVSIHGRPRSNRHTGEIDYAAIREVKEGVAMPVIGNGGIFTVEAARRMVAETGVDGVMIGRGGYGRPWFFRDCALALAGGDAGPEPSPEELREVMVAHFEGIVEVLGPERGVRSFRKCASWYFTDKPYGTYFRDMAFRSKTAHEMRLIIEAWVAHVAEVARAEEAGEKPRPPAVAEAWDKGPKPDWEGRVARVLERQQVTSETTCGEA